MGPCILVAGGTSAIAEAACKVLAARGATLILAGRDAARLSATAARLGAGVHLLTFDAGDPAAMAALIGEAAALAGGLDAVLIAHGSLSDQSRAQADPVYLAEEIAINLTSALALAEAAAARFETTGRGTIAVIGSVAGDRGKKRNYAYGACKAALDVAVAGMRHRFRRTDIRAVIIKPGPVDTPMTATHRKSALFSSPESVGRIVADAVGSGQGVVYAPGWWRWIMLVLRLLPEPVFTRLDI